jgi:transcriptional regulator with XRE-family HTH domain
MTTKIDEKLEFSLRLKKALKRSSKKVQTPSQLAIQFNLRSPTDPITTAAAQKWLNGTARPTVDKIDTLANWLNVSTQWLRFGIAENRPVATHERKGQTKKPTLSIQPTVEELKLLQKLRQLSEHQREIIAETVEQFGMSLEMWNDQSHSH